MRVKLEEIQEGTEQAVIQYKKMTPALKQAVRILQNSSIQIVGKKDDRQYMFRPEQVLYFESVDDKVFAYTREMEAQVDFTLMELEKMLDEEGFFRCNKSFIVNIYRIESLQSEMGNRIDAKLSNGEHVMISRRYAKEFRERLKGERA